MKVGPDAGAGANRRVSVAAALTAVLESGNVGSVTGNAGRRKPREHEVTGSLDDGVGWPLAHDHVIQPGEGADRVRMVAHTIRSTPRRGRDRVRGTTWCPRRALNLTRQSGTCTCTRKRGGTDRNREQRLLAHWIPRHLDLFPFPVTCAVSHLTDCNGYTPLSEISGIKGASQRSEHKTAASRPKRYRAATPAARRRYLAVALALSQSLNVSMSKATFTHAWNTTESPVARAPAA